MSGLTPNALNSTVFFYNCKSELPVRFLGVPLIFSKLSINDCMPHIDKITCRIYSWTNILLSLAGRLQLIKSVLFTIQAYWSNHFLLPGGVHKKLQSLFTHFLWKGDISQKGRAKVAWDRVCLPKSEGGLGLKNSLDWNRAQILYHLCRIVLHSFFYGLNG